MPRIVEIIEQGKDRTYKLECGHNVTLPLADYRGCFVGENRVCPTCEQGQIMRPTQNERERAQ